MKIKRTEVDAGIERDIVTAMIIDSTFLKKTEPIIRTELFQSSFVRTVAGWCLSYYQEFQSCPGQAIQHIYNSHKENLDPDMADLIDNFLDSISEEYERNVFNTEFTFKEAKLYFRKRNLLDLSAGIRSDISQGRIDDAEAKRVNYNEIVEVEDSSVDIFAPAVIVEGFEKNQNDVLFKLPGALGELILPFKRTDLVGVAAPMKRGKTWYLIDWAVRAQLAGCKVYFITLEMPIPQMSLRFYQNILGDLFPDIYYVNNNIKYEQNILIPFFNEEGEIDTKEESKTGITIARVMKKSKAVIKQARGGKIRLDNFPSYTINTDSLKNRLTILKHYHGFIPDVIIIDYADIMAPERNSPREPRQQINHTWMSLRKLAQETETCVIVPTQGSRASFQKDMEQDDTSEDIRKLAHVSRMIGINKGGKNKKDFNYDYEKKYSLRLNVIAERHGYFDPEEMVKVLRCFDIGKPYLDSMWEEN